MIQHIYLVDLDNENVTTFINTFEQHDKEQEQSHSNEQHESDNEAPMTNNEHQNATNTDTQSPVEQQHDTEENIQGYDGPVVKLQDYLDDKDTKDIANYLAYNVLPTANDAARRVILQAERFQLSEDKQILYHLHEPRSNRETQLQLPTLQKVIPNRYQQLVLQVYHTTLGHAGVQRMFLTMRTVVWWRRMYSSIVDHCVHCLTCNMSKRFYQKRPQPLYPIKTERPFSIVACDHVTFKQRSIDGHIGILLIVDLSVHMFHSFRSNHWMH